MKRFFLVILALILQCNMNYAQRDDGSRTVRGVIVHADSRLAILEKKHRNVQLGVIRSGYGFRVQIYSGNDRTKATEIKVDFMRRFPNIPTYMTYVQPQFRVKVGDFRSRAEAQQMYNQVNDFYNPSMIVSDIIVINTLKDD